MAQWVKNLPAIQETLVTYVSSMPASETLVTYVSSMPASGVSPGGGNGNPLQYSCLESPMDKGAWRATVHKVAKSQT